jgi:dTDP-4-amino-4,6-dideoxygalactose transaminase
MLIPETLRRSRKSIPLLDLGPMHGAISNELERAWGRVVSSNSFVGGIEVAEFERDWAAYCGTRFAVGVGNGTDALVLTLRALGIGPGDEVIVPANTFIATAEAVLIAGATPRFVDVDPQTLLVTPEAIADAIGPRTAAAIPVHLYGNVADMEAIGRVADRAGIVLIEDAAQAHGATFDGRKAGSFGVAGCFSFYPGKNLGAFGDGGAVVSDDAALVDRIRVLANHGRTSGSWYEHGAVGTNSRLDALQAAVLSVKLRHLDDWNESRRKIAHMYGKLLAGTRCEVVRGDARGRGVHHLMVVRVSDRDRVRDELRALGIETGIHYPVPCHQQGPYARFSDEPLPVSEDAATEIVSLPLFPHMKPAQIERVALAVRGAVGGQMLEPRSMSYRRGRR